MDNNFVSMLHGYRVLDLTDEKGLLCGKIMGDLGADVIKVERPGGDPARNVGPFYHDEPDPEKSLFWFAFNTSKRGITLDIENAGGQETFRKLVKTADFVIESFTPGHLSKLGLGYPDLEKLNPRIIMVSITPFGQSGPYADYKISDIVAWAMGGIMSQWGDTDRPPVHMSHHSQAYLHAGAAAAAGAMMALYQRQSTGEGQHVDVSIQESVCELCSFLGPAMFDVGKILLKRGDMIRPGIHLPYLWPCKDGHVEFVFIFGGEAGYRRSKPLVNYMADEGMADEFLKSIDFVNTPYTELTQEDADEIEKRVRKFFLTHTKNELFREAVKYNAAIYPLATAADMPDNIQLVKRDFWEDVEHPELGTTITYPGAFLKASETPVRIYRRAPLIGEHNREVFEEVQILKQDENAPPAKPPVGTAGEALKRKPLEGIKVVDFSWLIAGPLTSKALSDFGAEVILVEGKKRPGGFRQEASSFKGEVDFDRSMFFLPFNTGKRSIALDIAEPNGIELAKRLIAWADIVIDNYSGGSMDRMGLGYEELKKVNPDIIMVSLSMMGQTGPYMTYPGDGKLLGALAGVEHITGWPDRNPANILFYTDWIGPPYGVAAVLAALDYRQRTGKGQRLDLSQYETAIQFISPLILDWTVNRRVADRMGNRSVCAAPHGVFRCRGEDSWCAIAVFTDEEWQSFCRVIGNPEWTRYDRFSTLQARKENEDSLEALVESWTVNHSAGEVMTMMQAAGVAAGAVQNIEDLLEHDPQLKHRHFYWSLDHPVLGRYRCERAPFILSKASCELRYSPLISEHNEYVCKEILGMSDEEIAQMVIEGVVE